MTWSPRHVKCLSGGLRQHGRLGQIKSCTLSVAEGVDRLWSGCFNTESCDCHLFLVEWFIFSHCVLSMIIDPLLNWANSFANKLWKDKGIRGQETLWLEVFIKVASPRTCKWQSASVFLHFTFFDEIGVVLAYANHCWGVMGGCLSVVMWLLSFHFF